MRLIDSETGHLFVLPPQNVILLAPRRDAGPPPVLLTFEQPAPPPRTLSVHHEDGTIETWVQTPGGWQREEA